MLLAHLSIFFSRSKEIWRHLNATFSDKKTRTWIFAVAAASLLAIYWNFPDAADADLSHQARLDSREGQQPSDVTTFIPAGYVLVPIEVANFDSLDSILGPYGVVDLYLPAEAPHRRAKKIASHVKIMRAPLNPSRFAVLLKDDESTEVMAQGGPFQVILQNPNSRPHGHGTSIEMEKLTEADSQELPQGGRSRKKRSKSRSRISVEVTDADRN